MRIHSTLKPLVRELRTLGYRVEMARSSHLHICDEQGRLVGVAAGSPSDHRSAKNLRSDLRKRGVPV